MSVAIKDPQVGNRGILIISLIWSLVCKSSCRRMILNVDNYLSLPNTFETRKNDMAHLHNCMILPLGCTILTRDVSSG